MVDGLVPVVSYNTITCRSDLRHLPGDPLLAPESFKCSISGLIQKQGSTTPESRIFFSVFINVETRGIGRFVVVHQENSALLDKEKNSNPGSVLPGMQCARARRTRLLFM